MVTVAPLPPVHSAVTGAGQVTTGAVSSLRVKLVAQELGFPDASATLHVDEADPGADRERELGEQFAVMAPLQVSVAVAATARLARHAPPWDEVNTVAGAGQVMLGAWVSFTVTEVLQELELAEPSVALQVTLVVPSENVPEPGVQPTELTLQLSVAVALTVAVAPPPTHSRV